MNLEIEWLDDEPMIILPLEMMERLGWEDDQMLDFEISDDMLRIFAIE